MHFSFDMHRIVTTLVLFAAIAFALPSALANEFRGRMVGISDGDTLTLLTDRHEQVCVRRSDIDTPERCQPHGTRARQVLSDLAFRQRARIEVRDVDRYGRTVGRVLVG